MSAPTLLERVLARGGRVLAAGPRPRLLVPDDLKQLVECNREALRAEVARYLATLPNPRRDLWAMLDRWAEMDDAAVTQADVDALKDDIMDVFAAQPVDAANWYREWRAARA